MRNYIHSRPLFLGQICLMMFVSLLIKHAKADVIVGARSLAAECYQNSKKAAISGSASRFELDVCTRAINETGLPLDSLIGSYVNRGIILMAMDRKIQALADLNRALALDIGTGEAYVNRGNLKFSEGRLEEAIEDYDLAINYGVQQQYIAYLNRGIAKETLGYLTAAQRDYQSALAIREEWPEALSKLQRVSKAIEQERQKRAAVKG